MIARTALSIVLCTLALANPVSALGQLLGTVFTYQGELSSGGVPSNGRHDLRFQLFDAAVNGSPVGAIQCADNVGVVNGRFTVALDFGAQFAGQQRFLAIEVRADTGLGCGDGTGYTALLPRQSLSAAPNALFALNAETATSATSATTATSATNSTRLDGQLATFYRDAANLSSGSLPSARLSGSYTSTVNLTSASNTLSGNGAGLTSLNASSMTSGSLPDARLSGAYSNVLTLSNPANTFVGNYTGSGAALTDLNATNLFSGTLPSARLAGFYGNALSFSNSGNVFVGSGTGLTALNASNLGSGIVADARLPSNLLRKDAPVSLLSGALRLGTTSSNSPASGTQFQIGPISSDTSALGFFRVTDTTGLIGFRPTSSSGFANLNLRVFDATLDDSLIFQVSRTDAPDFTSNYSPLLSLFDNGKLHLGATGESTGRLSIGQVSSTFFPHIELRQNGGSGFSRLGFSHSATDRTWIVAAKNSDADIATDQINFYHNGGGISGAGNVLSISGGLGAGSGRVGLNTVSPIATLNIVGDLHLQGSGRDISVPSAESLQVGHFDGLAFTTRLSIAPTGNSTFTGDVAAPTATRWITLIATDFQPVRGFTNSSSLPERIIHSASGEGIASVSVQLPHGATVTAIRARVLDSSPDTNISVVLGREAFTSTSNTPVTVAQASSAGVSADVQTISNVAAHVVNNESNYYIIRVESSTVPTTGTIHFYRVQIEYTTPPSLR